MFEDFQLRGLVLDVLFCLAISTEILKPKFQRSNINRCVNISGEALQLGPLSVQSLINLLKKTQSALYTE
jgi:hypothetical protein